ncbi:Mitochondrial chaperone Frataxin [Trapelia coarctata]|nr:Mitochondrial chaperone Frataxin [Trapelia coarctata]
MLQFVRSSIRSVTKTCRRLQIRPQHRFYFAHFQCGRESKKPTQAAVQKQRSFLGCHGRLHPSTVSNRLNTPLYRPLSSTILRLPTSRYVSTGPSAPKATGYEGAKDRTEISIETYHQQADDYLNEVQQVVEEVQEEREDVDVEFSAGVLTIIFPPNGTYVINKQPPNKQIWLSSPVSGPKRYDYVCLGEDKESGDWVYLRDGSTMSGLLREEIGVGIEDGGT